MFESYINEISYMAVAWIFSMIGGPLKEHIYLPIVKHTMSQTKGDRIFRAFLGALVYLFLIYVGSIVIKEFILGMNLINPHDVDAIVIFGFIAFAFVLEMKHGISGDPQA